MDERYVLCRPLGGLNDMLCQLEACWRYCETYNRTLVFDAVKSGFSDQLDRYFVDAKLDHVRFQCDAAMLDHFDTLPCVPSAIQGRLRDYSVRHDRVKKFCDTETGARVSFEFDRDYDEPLLVHHQGGGGRKSRSFIKRTPLSDRMAEIVAQNQKAILSGRNDYCAVHVRNTDDVTDYISLVKLALEEAGDRDLLVCTDSHSAQVSLKETYGGRIFFNRVVPDVGDKPLHKMSTFKNDAAQSRQQMEDALCDLVALAAGSSLHYTDTSKGNPSGFSILAEFLHQNKRVLQRFAKLPDDLIASRDVASFYHKL